MGRSKRYKIERSGRLRLLFGVTMLTATLMAGAGAGAAEEDAASSPYGRYPELVTYTLGQMEGANDSNLPEGDTYEDNAYTRYLRQMLNVQNRITFSAQEDSYEDALRVLVLDQTMPDVLVISSRDTLYELVENDMLEDLTQSWEDCASGKIKQMYDSYGSQLLDSGRFDGRLLAIPETVIDHGPFLLWMRRDWIYEIGEREPETMEDAVRILKGFTAHGLGAKEGKPAVGLACSTSLVGTTSESYCMNAVFDLFDAHPQRWIRGEDGTVTYGSLTEETRQALAFLHSLYEEGVLDTNFALRAPNNLRDLVVSGECGAFFGLWWAPNNPLMEAVEQNPDADWQPYYVTKDAPSGTEVFDSFRDNRYVVVRKGYEHPEIVCKILSVLFDYTRYQVRDAEEINEYFALNVNPTARPLVINVDDNKAIFLVTEALRSALAGELSREELGTLEASYLDACLAYRESGEPLAADWAAWQSRITAVGLIADSGYTPPETHYLAYADTELPGSLQELEQDAFLQIIMGDQPLEYFDVFREEWYAGGGQTLTDRLNGENQ